MDITVDDLLFAIEHASLDLTQQKDYLARLDAAVGDGDLGVTVELGCRSLIEACHLLRGADVGTLLTRSGMMLSRAAPSTFGILVASALIEAGKEIPGQSVLTLPDLTKVGYRAVEAVQSRGNAKVGDKTMLDVLVPALEALDRARSSGTGLTVAMDDVVHAAEAGMRATIPLKAKFGRAAWMSEKSAGVQDAGATAVYLFLSSCLKQLQGRLKAREGDSGIPERT